MLSSERCVSKRSFQNNEKGFNALDAKYDINPSSRRASWLNPALRYIIGIICRRLTYLAQKVLRYGSTGIPGRFRKDSETTRNVINLFRFAKSTRNSLRFFQRRWMVVELRKDKSMRVYACLFTWSLLFMHRIIKGSFARNRLGFSQYVRRYFDRVG
ncbi:hypothetical protein BYT27DRAFT_6697774 [Phlegmacium glaucopus]|nr:hypothetical protein BYT27DRAFT_6697774 [Phlegmacium glaucopus]